MYTRCQKLQQPLALWLRTVIAARSGQDVSFLHFLLGRTLIALGREPEALPLLEQSLEVDPTFLNVHFEIVSLLIKLQDLERAEQALERLRSANAQSQFPRDAELANISAFFRSAKLNNSAASVPTN